MTQTTCTFPECDRAAHGRGVCRSHYMKCWRGQLPWPPAVPRRRPSPEERFWAKVQRGAGDDCWPWAASRYSNGYGQFGHVLAHRFSYELAVGPIPAGLVIDHTCGQRYCVNPAHLEAVTPRENVRRGYAPNVAARLRRDMMYLRERCKNGHELTEDNTYVTPREGWRQCRTCRAARPRRKRRVA